MHHHLNLHLQILRLVYQCPLHYLQATHQKNYSQSIMTHPCLLQTYQSLMSLPYHFLFFLHLQIEQPIISLQATCSNKSSSCAKFSSTLFKSRVSAYKISSTAIFAASVSTTTAGFKE